MRWEDRLLQRRQERRERARGLDFYRVLVDRCDRNRLAIHHQDVLRAIGYALVERGAEGELDVSGGERRAILPANILSKVESPHCAALVVLPPFCQNRFGFERRRARTHESLEERLERLTRALIDDQQWIEGLRVTDCDRDKRLRFTDLDRRRRFSRLGVAIVTRAEEQNEDDDEPTATHQSSASGVSISTTRTPWGTSREKVAASSAGLTSTSLSSISTERSRDGTSRRMRVAINTLSWFS